MTRGNAILTSSPTGVESLLAQFGFEERDNKFQEQIAEQLLAAQQALANSHENVMTFVGRKLESVRQVEIENQLLSERIASHGGPSSSSSSYLQTAGGTEDTAGSDSQLDGKSGTLSPAKSATTSMLEPLPMTATKSSSHEPPPPPSPPPPAPHPSALKAIVPAGEPSCMGVLPGECLDRVDEDEGSCVSLDEQELRSEPVALKTRAHQDEGANGSPPISPTGDQDRASGRSQKSGVTWSPAVSREKDDLKDQLTPLARSMFLAECDRTSDVAEEALRRPSSISESSQSAKPVYRRGMTDPRGLADSETRKASNASFISQSSARQKSANSKFVVLEDWEMHDQVHFRAKVGTIHSTKAPNRDLIRKATHAGLNKQSEFHEEKRIIRWLRKVVIHPCGVKRAVWDMLSLCLVTYDMAVLPLQLFDPPPSTFTSIMEWVTRLFWTADMPVSVSTGFLLGDGSIQMHPGEVAKHYLMSWFGLDALLVALDWFEVFISSQASSAASDYGRLGKMGRTFRIVRMVRLLRLVRMREIIKLMTFRMQSERLVILADIAKILIFIIAVAHLMACFWYGIGDESDPANTWMGEFMVMDMALEHKYLISMHWAVSQFSGGMDEFRAKNFKERFYNVTVFLAAFMMAAVCISGLTSSMTRLHILSSHQSRQLSTLRRYLIQNGISDRLALRVQRNALHAISEQQRLMAEKHVELLGAVSEPLRVELHFEMYSPVLEVHPFFSCYIQECPQVMMRVCHQAMSTLLVSSGDVIFNPGEIPEHPKFYIVCNGSMEYIPNSGVVAFIGAEEWLSEGSLWTHWMHRGMLKAKSDGRLCMLEAKKMIQIVLQFDHPEFDPREYAVEFVTMLNELQDDKVPITDLKCEDQDDFMTVVKEFKGVPTVKHKLLTQIGGGPRNMMDSPAKQRRESVLFVPSRTAKLRRNNSTGRLVKK